MKTPDDKDGPKLPPKPKGGGAAARQRQFQMERGLPAESGADEAEENPPADEAGEAPKKPKPKK